MIKFQPVIKWSGSKRSQCEDILEYFPQNIETYYEPFCGGCSMLMGLMNSDIFVKRYVCSDINKDLIALWEKVKYSPDEIYESYVKLWEELNKDNDIYRKRKFFEEQRKIYNETHNPLVFFFIMRTTTNGMPRYNQKGEFNNSFHVTRNGIKPELLKPILYEWSEKLRKNNVEFVHRSYEEILGEVKEGDFIYMDPPYISANSMYMRGTINFADFFNFLKLLRNNNIKFALSFDGKSGNVDNTYNIPNDCYDIHTYIKSGNSSFKRTIGKNKNAIVYESLYLDYIPKNINSLW